jgi:hypothetical protein
MKIDIFPHILPRRYLDRMLRVAPPGLALQKRMSGIPALVDLDLRLRMMDRHEGYVQVLTLPNPPLEVVGTDFPFDPERSPGFIRDTIAPMERMQASAEDKTKIYESNARRLLRLKLTD